MVVGWGSEAFGQLEKTPPTAPTLACVGFSFRFDLKTDVGENSLDTELTQTIERQNG